MSSKGYKHTEEFKEKARKLRLGYKFSEETKRKIGLGNLGKKATPEQLERAKIAHSGIRIKDQSLIKRQDRHDCPLYKEWRKKIWIRDNFICQKCKKATGKINAHHICNFIDFPEFRMNLENGITFCVFCHRQFHSRYGKHNNSREQLQEFLTNK